jgi:hypothetical protein
VILQHRVDRLTSGYGRIQLSVDHIELYRSSADSALGVDLVHRELNAGKVLSVRDLERTGLNHRREEDDRFLAVVGTGGWNIRVAGERDGNRRRRNHSLEQLFHH